MHAVPRCIGLMHINRILLNVVLHDLDGHTTAERYKDRCVIRLMFGCADRAE